MSVYSEERLCESCCASAFGITAGLGYNLVRKSVREAGVALELNQLTDQVAAMDLALAARANARMALKG